MQAFNHDVHTIKAEKHTSNILHGKDKNIKWKIHHKSLFSFLIQVSEGEAETKQTHTTL